MTLRATTAVLMAWLSLQGATAQGPPPQAAPQASRPSLVVVIVVDQMRVDYLERYASTFSSGLRRLIDQGAWFTNGAYPYLNTVTCAGHATIGTGTFPYRHGMIMNAWYDREAGKSPYCTDDATVREISYNGLEPGLGDSARRLLAPALGEQIHARGGRSAALSLKPRSAIPLAGHRADAVLWFDERGGWTTSTAFSDSAVPFLQQFIAANPLSADYDKVWERSLDPAAYQNSDDETGEGTTGGWTKLFPHPLGAPGGAPNSTFYSRWQRSPYADEYLGRIAAAAVDALELGAGPRTDFLAVSFSTLDLVGHAFGPRSHEVQDLLVRLDRTIGRLLDHLDARVGAGRYVVGFSSDHGVADVPEQAGAGGRQPAPQIFAALQRVLEPVLGAGQHVLATAYTDIYLSARARQRLFGDAKLMREALAALNALPAVARVLRGDELSSARARTSGDPAVRAAALSYRRGRSGDLVIVPRQNWLLTTSVTTHGTLHAYDQRVPVLFFGASVRPGRYPEASSPADLAPTLAAIAGIPM